jgi:hypothetical protein
MSSTIKVDNIQNQCGANIIKEDSNTITLGASGDTVTLASGASQTGFGREGSVDWQTSIKTTSFTAVSGEGYFINTTSGAITMTLPASPSVGDIVAFKDYAGTFQTNNLTINRNGSNIVGGTNNAVISVEGQAVVLVYGDATQGWQPVEAATNSDVPRPTFLTATGGTITTSGNCKIHTFTGPGTFCVSSISNTPANNQVSYMVVAGGGGGGNRGTSTGEAGGGGGAGGFREDKSPVTPYTASPLEGAGAITVTATAFPITVGSGGTGAPGCAQPGSVSSTRSGSNSSFSTITSAGGGGGGNRSATTPIDIAQGAAGGSGGGGSYSGPINNGAPGGSGNAPSVSPSQGNNGGNGPGPGGNSSGGGGGGATAAGSPSSQSAGPTCGQGGAGGAGATTSINGTPTAFTGGGGGGGNTGTPTGAAGTGGTGGGGKGGDRSPTNPAGVSGTTNTGGGGGGGSGCGGGGAGGSGIVIIRYRFQ